jgi:hypothetical protein
VVESRLKSLLGFSADEAALLVARTRAALGNRAYAVRAVAFVLATAPLLRRLLPLRTRRAAIRPLVYALLPGPSENLLYAGVRVGVEGERGR